MSFFVGKLTRHVSKKHNEYFTGKFGNIPVRGSWSKKEKGQDDLCVWLDKEKIDYLSKENKASASAGAGEAKQ